MASPVPNPATNLGAVHPFPPMAQTLSLPYAALVHRVAAYVIDLIIAFSVMMAAGFASRILFAAGLVTPVPPTDPVSLWASLSAGLKLAVLFAYMLAMGPIYFALFESSPWQATFGKRLLTSTSPATTASESLWLDLPSAGFPDSSAVCSAGPWPASS
jgi:hypothetical protein